MAKNGNNSSLSTLNFAPDFCVLGKFFILLDSSTTNAALVYFEIKTPFSVKFFLFCLANNFLVGCILEYFTAVETHISFYNQLNNGTRRNFPRQDYIPHMANILDSLTQILMLAVLLHFCASFLHHKSILALAISIHLYI